MLISQVIINNILTVKNIVFNYIFFWSILCLKYWLALFSTSIFRRNDTKIAIIPYVMNI